MKKVITGYLRTIHGLSQRKAALLVKTTPNVLRYESKHRDCEPVRAQLKELAQQRPPEPFQKGPFLEHLRCPRPGPRADA